jgi:RNA polymerase sigma factor (sigma-70 family)
MVRLAATDANATITPALATTCARNAVIDYYRWHGRWNLCELSFTLAAYDNTERAATNVLLAQHILRLLPPRWATVLRLRYMEELSIEETAAVMGIPTGSVKSSASLAKAAARVLLGIDPVPPPRTFPHRNLGTRCKHD